MGNDQAEEARTGKKDDNELKPPYDFKGGIPEEQAWFLSHLFFIWMRPLFKRAQYLTKHKTALQQHDLLPLPSIDHGAPILADFERSWERAGEELAATAEKQQSKRTKQQSKTDDKTDKDAVNKRQEEKTDRIRKALFGVMGRRFIVAGFIKVLNTCLQFSFPLILNAILKFIEDTQAGVYDGTDPWYDRYRGYWLSAILFGVMAGKALAENAYFFRVYRAGYQARVAVSVAVYNKALRLSNQERQSTTLGELVNLMQVCCCCCCCRVCVCYSCCGC